MYLSSECLGQNEGASAPASSYVEASLVSRLEALRASIDAQRESDLFFNEVHRFLAGAIGGAAIGFFCSEQNRSKSARIGAIVGGASQLVVGILVSLMRGGKGA